MNRHPFSATSLVAGVIMLGLSLQWFVRDQDLLSQHQLALVGAAVLIAAGLAGIVATRAQPGDYVVCLGAGTITQWAYALPGELAALKG